jgi:hypothetical protein
MAHVSYIGRTAGSNGELEKAKTEALQLQNELTRVRLEKLRGDVVEKREVQFALGYALTTLREHILRVPQLVTAALRGFDHAVVHGIRMRIDESVRRSLEELAETLCRAVSAKDFFASLDNDEDNPKVEDDDAVARKKAAVNARRREKRALKAARRFPESLRIAAAPRKSATVNLHAKFFAVQAVTERDSLGPCRPKKHFLLCHRSTAIAKQVYRHVSRQGNKHTLARKGIRLFLSGLGPQVNGPSPAAFLRDNRHLLERNS